MKKVNGCQCGRSLSGFCDKSHEMSLESWTTRLMSIDFEDRLYPEQSSYDSDHKSPPYART